MNADHLTVALAQIAPVWLNRVATIAKVVDYIDQAKHKNVDIITFGEALIPGYPFWIELTGGARFNAPDQKAIHAHYINQAVQIEAGHLDPICLAAKENKMAIYIGIIERAKSRRPQSLLFNGLY